MNSIELREAIRAKFAWPGGYEIFGVTGDGGTLCCDCMRKEYRQVAWSRRNNVNDGWKVDAVDCMGNVEGPITCDNCGKEIA